MYLRLSTQALWLAPESVDFRKSIDGLSALVHRYFASKPTEGVYIFYNRARDKVKILCWHGNGYVLLYKRLERGKFHVRHDARRGYSISVSEVQWLLAGLDWQTHSHWQSLGYTDVT